MIIDNREHHIKKYFMDLNKNNISIKQMDIGDIEFKYKNTTVLIIERKTISDLSSSIKDGRHREQKSRLLEIGKNKLLYLIEGSHNNHISCLPKSTIISSLINTLIRDNIKIYHTSNMDDTIFFLELLYKKFMKEPEKLLNNSGECNYVSNIKLKKKDNLTPKNCSILQLAQIPGCSITIANRIIQEYESIFILCNKYHSIKVDDREKLLADLKYSISNNKERRIGHIVSKRIYDFLNY